MKIYGDIAQKFNGRHSGQTLYLHWNWRLNKSTVTQFRVGAFSFNVFDCKTDKVIWYKNYNYDHGTSQRSADGRTHIRVSADHGYAVQVSAFGTYERRYPNGSKGVAYIGNGVNGQDVSFGGCV